MKKNEIKMNRTDRFKAWFIRNRTLLLIITSGLIIYLIYSPVRIYRRELGSEEYSADPAVWGQFGDYIGGTLNPLLALINIVVLIYISWQVSNWEKQKYRGEFIHQCYRELLKEIESVKYDNVQSMLDLTKYLKSFWQNYQYLFSPTDQQRLEKKLTRYKYSNTLQNQMLLRGSEYNEKLQSNFVAPERGDVQTEIITLQMKIKMIAFEDKNNLLAFFQRFLMHEIFDESIEETFVSARKIAVAEYEQSLELLEKKLGIA